MALRMASFLRLRCNTVGAAIRSLQSNEGQRSHVSLTSRLGMLVWFKNLIFARTLSYNLIPIETLTMRLGDGDIDLAKATTKYSSWVSI